MGALAYPGQRPTPETHTLGAGASIPDLDPNQTTVALADPVVVRSGHTVRGELAVSNLAGPTLTIHTNGHLTSTIVEPGSGRDVGGFAGPQITPLILYPAPAGASGRIPLLIGTTSFVPDLG